MGRGEQPQLRGVGRRRRGLVRQMVTRLEHPEHLPGAPHDGGRQAREPGDVDGVFVVSLSLETKFPSLIQRLTSERHLPLPGPSKKLITEGALFYYGPNYRTLGVAAAQYVDKILKGTKPADLPVEYPRRFELILNGNAARALGLTIPQTLLLQADEVIR